ncbi:phage head-tail adapter protein [Sphingomonas sp. Leaf407]|nr:phage head-tail adapter protein [Sphingomonas sp. Leaf42]KQT30825.1 phage head-tail adapter protein [Sphingomonas sp. Leaf407]
MATAALDRRIVILRPSLVDDGTATIAGPPAEVGKRWAKKTDVSDGERMRAAQEGQTLTTRFLVRADALTKTIDGTYALTCAGVTYQVTGTKEWGGRNIGVEITATAQPAQLA